LLIIVAFLGIAAFAFYYGEYIETREHYFDEGETVYEWHFIHLPESEDVPGKLVPQEPSLSPFHEPLSVVIPVTDLAVNGTSGSRTSQVSIKEWVDLGEPENRMAVRVAAARIRQLPKIRLPLFLWFEEFEKWEVQKFLNATEDMGICSTLHLLSTGETFLKRVRRFLIEQLGFREEWYGAIVTEHALTSRKYIKEL
jgi:hypothetical protein